MVVWGTISGDRLDGRLQPDRRGGVQFGAARSQVQVRGVWCTRGAVSELRVALDGAVVGDVRGAFGDVRGAVREVRGAVGDVRGEVRGAVSDGGKRRCR